MPFQIYVDGHFSATHQLRLYDGSLEDLHGHLWRVRVAVTANQLDSAGLVMDFHVLERILNHVLDPLNNTSLNDLPVFATSNPSAENVALHIATSLRLPGRVRLLSVEVWETPENSAIYLPDQQ